MTWASVARADYRPAKSSANNNHFLAATPNSAPNSAPNSINANVVGAVAQASSTNANNLPPPSNTALQQRQQQQPLPASHQLNHLNVRHAQLHHLSTPSPSVTPQERIQSTPARAATPSHIAIDAWPLVGQTAEEARTTNNNNTTSTTTTTTNNNNNNILLHPTSISSSTSIGNTSTSTGTSGTTATSTNTTATTTSTTSQPTTRAPTVAAPRRSVWGPPDPPQRPPSTTAVAPTNNRASPPVLPPSPLHIPPLNNSIANGVRLRGATGAPAALVIDEAEAHTRLARVQEYYVLAFQRSAHDFLVNFFTNMAFQAGVLSAGLSPDVAPSAPPKLINSFAQILGNDQVFYAKHLPNSNFGDWVGANTSPPPPLTQQPNNSPRAPRSPNSQQNRRSVGNGRQRQAAGPPNRANGDTHRNLHAASPFHGAAIAAAPVNGTPPPFGHAPFPPVAIFPHLQQGFPASVHHVSTRVTSRSLVKIPAMPNVPVAAPHIVSTLERECARMIPSIQPSDEERKRRAGLIAHLQKAVKSEWSGATVSCFGSAANGLALAQGDVDICLMVPRGAKKLYRGALAKGKTNPEMKAENEVQVLRSIKDILVRNKMEIRSDLCHARVPILKLFDPKSGFQIDMCVNNRLVDHNTALVATYMDLDERVRPLCLLIKSWAKNRDVNTTYRGTLSSYAYVLLVISFCQTRSPPVLPCLQRMINGKELGPDDEVPKSIVTHADKSSESPTEYNVYFDRIKMQWVSRNQESLSQLLLGFFKYYAFEFDYAKSVVAVRTGGLITRESKGWDQASVQQDAEEAEREFREDKQASEAEEEAQRRMLMASESAETEETVPETDSVPNGVDQSINLGVGKVILDASAEPFLPVSPSTQQQGENEGPSAVATAVDQSQTVSSKPASVRSQDSIKSDSNEDAVVAAKAVNELEAGVAKLAVANGNAEAERGDSVSSSVTSADASPAVTAPRSPIVKAQTPLVATVPAPVRDRLRKPRPVERHAFCIEDPFNLSHDLSRGADEDTIYVIREEFYRAYSILSETGNLGNALMPLHLDISPYPIVSPGVGRTIPTPPALQVAGTIATAVVANNVGATNGGGGNRSGGRVNHHHHHRRNGGNTTSGRTGGGGGGYGRQRNYTNRQGNAGASGGRAGGGQHRSRGNAASGSPRHGAQR